MRVIIASGYFDPIHEGHIEYLQKAKELGDLLIVIVNNDYQTKKKKGYIFQKCENRIKIVDALECVNVTAKSIDKGKSVKNTIKEIKALFRTIPIYNEFAFVNGGDRHQKEIPEAKTCRELGIEMIDGLGKKVNSSSELVRRAKRKK